MEFAERSLIIGKGQIGTAIYETLKKKNNVFIRDIKGPKYEKVDILHIAFGYSDNFVNQVSDYIEQYAPKLVIVYSTVPIGTCERIGTNIVHSPVEGRHPHLHDSIELGVRWLGSSDEAALRQAVEFWSPFVKMVRTLTDSKFTEFLKLRSTSKFGINLVWTDYEKAVSDDLGMDFEAVKLFDGDYNDLYESLGYEQFKRYTLDAPNGKIGGHCVVPNSFLLDKHYPNDMLKMIMAYEPEGGK